MPVGRVTAARLPLQDQFLWFRVVCRLVRHVLPKLHVWQSGCLGLVDNHAVSGLVDVVVQTEVGGDPTEEELGFKSSIPCHAV